MIKEELRKKFKQKRKDLLDEERELLSQLIADNLLEWNDLKNLHVSVFLPIEKLNEINTWSIVDVADAKFYLPVVQDEKLKHILYESKDQLEISDLGIPEPIRGQEVEAELFDIVLVPLLALDSEGGRVGYGAGFYDGFLTECKSNCLFVGLSFFEPVEKISDLHSSDVSLHYCVTPNSIHSFL